MPSSLTGSSMSTHVIMSQVKKKAVLLCLFMAILSIAIGVTIWAGLRYRETTFFVLVLVLQIIMSMLVGALAALFHSALAKRHEDVERDGSSSISASSGSTTNITEAAPEGFNSTVITNNSEPGTFRNFSLSREHWLDPVAVNTTRPLSRPPRYLATAIDSKVAVNPLPASLDKNGDAQMPLPRFQMISEFVVQPLDIHLTQKRKSQLLPKTSMEELQLVAGTSATVKLPVNIASYDTSRITFFPVLEDDSFQQSTKASSTVAQSDVESKAESVEDNFAEPMHQRADACNSPRSPDPFAAPAIQVKEATPTTSLTCGSHSPSPTKVSTIRLVDSFLELPQKVYSELPSEDGNESSTASPTRHPGRQASADSNEDLAELIIEGSANNPATVDAAPGNALPAIETQQQVHSSPVVLESNKALDAHTTARSDSPTIRPVNTSLEMPVKHGVDSLGKRWKGQPGFLGL